MGNLPGRRNDLEGVEGDIEGEEDLYHLLPRGTLVARMQKDFEGMGGVEEGKYGIRSAVSKCRLLPARTKIVLKLFHSVTSC